MAGLASKKLSQSELQTRRTRVDDEEDVELKYKLGKELGRGAFGVVLEGTQLSSGKVFAVKVIPKERGPQMELIDREVEVLESLKHPHIIHLEEVLETPKKIYLVMELCAGGLADQIKEQGPLAEKDARVIMEQLASAVSYMHQNGMVHRDLKLENILITAGSDPLHVQVTDFGLAHKKQKGFAGGEDRMLDGTCGTLLYMAPEVLENKLTYSDHCDVWSLGVILYELLCGKVPFYDTSVVKLNEVIRAGKLEFSEPQWAGISEAAKDLITRMLYVDTTRRLRVGEVLVHQWIKGGSTGEMHIDIFQMMQEVNGGPKPNSNGLGAVKEEEESGGSPRGRRKTSMELPATPLDVKPRQRLKSDIGPSPRGGGQHAQSKSKHMSRSAASTTGLPARGRRPSSESSAIQLPSHSKIKQSASFTSLKDKK